MTLLIISTYDYGCGYSVAWRFTETKKTVEWDFSNPMKQMICGGCTIEFIKSIIASAVMGYDDDIVNALNSNKEAFSEAIVCNNGEIQIVEGNRL